MTEQPKNEHYIDWNTIAKIAIAVIGALLTTVVAWAASAAEKQAVAFDKLKDAVYNGQTKAAVLETKVNVLESKTEGIDGRVKRIEARMFEGQK